MKKRKYKLKKSVKKFFIIVVLFLIIVAAFKFGEDILPEPLKIVKNNFIKNVEVVDNKISINLKNVFGDEVFCIVSNETPQIDDKNWVKHDNLVCKLDYNSNNHNIYIKYNDKIYSFDKKSYYVELKEVENIYLPLNGEYNLFKYLVGKNDTVFFSDYDNTIISLDEFGNIKGLKDGNTTIHVYGKVDKDINVYVTYFITSLPDVKHLNKKEKLKCNFFSNEDNILLDNILKDRINTVGYKTRAGAVEAARFLSLEFNYKVDYFYENGRLTTNKVDGEGRYYHEGLYLSSDKLKSISYSTRKPAIWGCSLLSNPTGRYSPNGMDCSGFVSWAILNGGFDVGDMGAGWSSRKNLTDIGELKKFNKSLFDDNKIKVGDLLHAEEGTGHIGMIIGIDKDNYYVAQSIWFDQFGVVVSTYKKNNISKDWWTHVVLMDKYYKEDGNLTTMWY